MDGGERMAVEDNPAHDVASRAGEISDGRRAGEREEREEREERVQMALCIGMGTVALVLLVLLHQGLQTHRTK